jgi:hypothetical protein
MNELERRLYRRETQLLSLVEQHPGILLRDLALGLAVLGAVLASGRRLLARRQA